MRAGDPTTDTTPTDDGAIRRTSRAGAERDDPTVTDDISDAPRRRRRIWPWILLGIFLVLVVAAGVAALGVKHLADRAFVVRDELTAAKDVAATIPGLASSRDTAGLQAASADLARHTDAALAATEDPLWSWVEQVPMVGANLSAVRKTTGAADILVERAVPPAVELLTNVGLERFAITDGRIDLAALQSALPVIPELREAVAAAQDQVADIDRDQLLPQVDEAIGQLLDVLDDAAPLLNEAERVLPVALDMLGQNEQRNYILMFQNTAETRTTGGNPAALALLRVEDGAISLPEQTGSTDLGYLNSTLDFGLPPEMLQLYESDTTAHMMNYTRTPEFPTSARMMTALWQQQFGGTIDGVISLDPIVLQHLLEATGPVILPDGAELRADNAASVLLADAYHRYADNPSQDAFFKSAVAGVFAKLMSGAGTPQTLLDALLQGVAEHRVMMWMTRPAEQALAVEYDATGAFAADNTQVTQVGTFINDAGYSKLEYYLSASIHVTADVCPSGDGPATITTAITLTSAAPTSGLAPYQLTGRGPRLGVPRSTMILDILSFAPVGGQIVSVDPDGGDWTSFHRTGVEQNRAAETITIGLAAGETRTVTYTATVDRAGLGQQVDVRYTPLVGEVPVTIDQKPCS